MSEPKGTRAWSTGYKHGWELMKGRSRAKPESYRVPVRDRKLPNVAYRHLATQLIDIGRGRVELCFHDP
jgi:hypothetical protein